MAAVQAFVPATEPLAVPSWLVLTQGVEGPIPATISVGSAALSGATAVATAPTGTATARGAAAVGSGAAILAVVGRARARRQRRPRALRGAVALGSTSTTTTLPTVDRNATKEFRRALVASDQYSRFGKSQMESATATLKEISGSTLVTKLRTNGFRLTVGDITFVLAESYGFCWGVERAVAMAYEARTFFPDKNIWVTNEIIHNPDVNNNLRDMGMKIIQTGADGKKDYSAIQEGDVAILPAFGASVDEMAFFQEKKAHIVDTTCPWVSKVWMSVERSKAKQHTSIIHGKAKHEETIGTMSFARKYIVVKDLGEAEYVAQYMLGQGDREEFMKKFEGAMCEDFDPDTDLERVGVANQTTMLKGETNLIGKLFERTLIKKYGPQKINQHYISFNTICDATQERQDAMYKMFDTVYEPPSSKLYAELEGEQVGIELKSDKNSEELSSKKMEEETKGAAVVSEESPAKVDICLIVGGFNSSNTEHLLEIALEEGVPAYHVDSADRILGNSIQHKPLSTPLAEASRGEGLKITENFLPKGPVTVGVTSGASTPDKILGEVLERIMELRGLES